MTILCIKTYPKYATYHKSGKIRNLDILDLGIGNYEISVQICISFLKIKNFKTNLKIYETKTFWNILTKYFWKIVKYERNVYKSTWKGFLAHNSVSVTWSAFRMLKLPLKSVISRKGECVLTDNKNIYNTWIIRYKHF